MKLLKKYLLFIVLCMLPLVVHASGGISVNKTNISIARGSSTTFTVKANNAAGRIDISSSDTSVATVSASSAFLDNDSLTVTVRSIANGSATISVRTTDMATYDGEVVENTISIKVSVTDPLSGNTALKTLEVEGYELEKISDTEYSLKVSNSKETININAVADDTKATVTGTGEHHLDVGENVIEVIVHSESGTSKTYRITVTRKNDTYTLADLEDFADAETNNIIVHNDEIVTAENITNIKKNKKSSYNFINNDNEVKYTLIVNANDLTATFEPTIIFTSKNDIGKISNYAAGITSITQTIPKNTTIKMSLTSNIATSDKVNIYKYSNGKLTLVESVKVQNGEITYKADSNTEYFITPAKLEAEEEPTTEQKKKTSPIAIIITVCGSLALVIIIFIVLFSKKKDDDNKKSSTSSSSTYSPSNSYPHEDNSVNMNMNMPTNDYPLEHKIPTNNDFESINDQPKHSFTEETNNSLESTMAEAFPSLYEETSPLEQKLGHGEIVGAVTDELEPLPVPEIDIVNTGDLPIPVSLNFDSSDDNDDNQSPTIV